MKKLLTFLLLLPLVCSAATIHWFSDSTDTTTLPSNFVFAVENPGPPQGYRSVRWGTLRDLIGTSTNYLQQIFVTNFNGKQTFITDNYTTNLYVSSNAYFYETNFVNYEYTTNLFVTSNAYFYETNFANYTYTTNLFVESNAYFFETNFANYTYTTNLFVESNAYFYETNFVNWNITTNLTVVSNAYVTQIFVNDGTFTNNIHFVTNVWSYGPSGVVDLSKADQYYAAGADMELQGVVAKSNTVASSVLLNILASGADRTLYYGAGFTDGNGDSSIVCTQDVLRVISIRYTPAFGGLTNVVSRSFWR